MAPGVVRRYGKPSGERLNKKRNGSRLTGEANLLGTFALSTATDGEEPGGREDQAVKDPPKATSSADVRCFEWRRRRRKEKKEGPTKLTSCGHLFNGAAEYTGARWFVGSKHKKCKQTTLSVLLLVGQAVRPNAVEAEFDSKGDPEATSDQSYAFLRGLSKESLAAC
ncbi:hypothetical protein HYQ46_008998 [Verticillium longisporum]|nr:hypothetical protein HYQ46_008998 [Verticillium longisporum]